MTILIILPCSEHLAFPERAGYAFHSEACGKHGAAYFAFGAIGNEDTAGTQGLVHTLEHGAGPQFGLCARCEGVVVDQVVGFVVIQFLHGCGQHAEGEPTTFGGPVGGGGRHPFQEGGMQSGPCELVAMVQLFQQFSGKRRGFQGGIAHAALALPAADPGQQQVEAGAEAHFEDVDSGLVHLLQSGLDEDVGALLDGAMHAVVEHIKRIIANGEGAVAGTQRAIVGMHAPRK